MPKLRRSHNKLKQEKSNEGAIENSKLKYCLSCMKYSDRTKDIMEKFENCIALTLYEALGAVTDFKMRPNEDHLPSQLCWPCETELKISYDFKMKIENSDSVYRNQLAAIFIPQDASKDYLFPKVEMNEQEAPENTTIVRGAKFVSKEDDESLKLEESKGTKITFNQFGPFVEDSKSFLISDDCLHDDNFVESNDDLDEKHADLVPEEKLIQLTIDNNSPAEVIQSFTCSICPNKYLYRASLDKHIKRHKRVQKDQECPICHRLFYSNTYIKEHMRRNHPDPDAIKCVQCGRLFKTNEALEEHNKTHELERENICKHCSEKFEDKDTLRQHIIKIHFPFECRICGKRLNIKSSWIAHERNHKLFKPYGCNECPRKYRSVDLLRIHRFCVHQNVRYDCVYCIQKFTAKRFLLNHIKIHHTNNDDDELVFLANKKPFPYACNSCTLRFEEASDLKEHDCKPILKHDCDQCPERFPLRSQLKLHVRNDHDNVLEKCTKCNRFFKRKKFERHLQTHTQGYVPKKTCPQCFKDYNEKNFERHMLTHQPGYVPTNPVATSYKCEECNKIFFREVNYKKHMETHSQN